MDAITDDTNLWLRGVRSHDSGDYLGAFRLYLNDAADCLSKGSLNRAALSCSCAADCLFSLDMLDEARRLYYESALLSKLNSEIAIGSSVRESLWSLLQAYDRFLLAGDNNEAEKIYLKYVSLARRTNPIDGEADATEILRARKRGSRFEPDLNQQRGPTKQDLPSDLARIRGDVEKFIALRNRMETTATSSTRRPLAPQGRDGRIERSIVS